MGKRKIKKKIIGIMVGMMACSSVTTFAKTQSTSQVINFKELRANAYLNVFDDFEGAASTVLKSGTKKQNLIVSLYLKSKNGATLDSRYKADSKTSVYVSFYKQGSQNDPGRVWESQHSTQHKEDPYYHLRLYI